MLDEILKNASFENNMYLIGEAIYTVDCLIREERNKQLNNEKIDVFSSQYMTFADFQEIKYIQNCAINENIEYLNDVIFTNDYVANYILEKGYFLENVFNNNLINQDELLNRTLNRLENESNNYNEYTKKDILDSINMYKKSTLLGLFHKYYKKTNEYDKIYDNVKNALKQMYEENKELFNCSYKELYNSFIQNLENNAKEYTFEEVQKACEFQLIEFYKNVFYKLRNQAIQKLIRENKAQVLGFNTFSTKTSYDTKNLYKIGNRTFYSDITDNEIANTNLGEAFGMKKKENKQILNYRDSICYLINELSDLHILSPTELQILNDYNKNNLKENEIDNQI